MLIQITNQEPEHLMRYLHLQVMWCGSRGPGDEKVGAENPVSALHTFQGQRVLLQITFNLALWTERSLISGGWRIFYFRFIWEEFGLCTLQLHHVNQSMVSGDDWDIASKMYSWSELKC